MTITLAVDCMGGDHGPRVTLRGLPRISSSAIPKRPCCWSGAPAALAGF